MSLAWFQLISDFITNGLTPIALVAGSLLWSMKYLSKVQAEQQGFFDDIIQRLIDLKDVVDDINEEMVSLEEKIEEIDDLTTTLTNSTASSDATVTTTLAALSTKIDTLKEKMVDMNNGCTEVNKASITRIMDALDNTKRTIADLQNMLLEHITRSRNRWEDGSNDRNEQG